MATTPDRPTSDAPGEQSLVIGVDLDGAPITLEDLLSDWAAHHRGILFDPRPWTPRHKTAPAAVRLLQRPTEGTIPASVRDLLATRFRISQPPRPPWGAR
ncbi:hypothetical protein [Nocardia wallacei]|uniref:hypothetical protein n=1 Tax=Nocardia wallacei TaxID=480035 RepID=UPI002457403E|nr:hypothetical protein [Nocardia wallacei]